MREAAEDRRQRGAERALEHPWHLELCVGCGLAPAPEAQQSLEGGHRLPAAIVPKHEFIKIHRELLPAYPVVGSNEPLLHISNGAVGQGHHRFRPFTEFNAQRLDARHVLVTGFFQPVEAL